VRSYVPRVGRETDREFVCASYQGKDVFVYIYIFIRIYVYIICIYIERERSCAPQVREDREREFVWERHT